MYKKKLLLITYCLLLIYIVACGNRRSATGGPEDTVRPEILYTSPLPFEQIENSEIVLSFSKTMDKTTVLSGLHINPPKVARKLVWKKNNLHIVFTEPLPDDRNVVVFLNKSIKCERGNFFSDHQILTFRNGALQDNKVSGYIILDDELVGKDIQTTLLDADSLLVFHQMLIGENYSFEQLNSGQYTLNAFVDMNKNNRFDYSVDAAFNTTFTLPITHNIDIQPVIADTVKPNIKTIKSPFNNQIIIDLNKKLINVPAITIIADSTDDSVDIIHKEMVETTIYLLTSPMDTLSYTLTLTDLIDTRGNERNSLQTKLTSDGVVDTTAIRVLDISPKNGTIVSDKDQNITITFDKIMFSKDIVISLREIETQQTITLITKTNAAMTLHYAPSSELKDFNSYQLTIHKETKDILGNTMIEDYSVQFILVTGL